MKQTILFLTMTILLINSSNVASQLPSFKEGEQIYAEQISIDAYNYTSRVLNLTSKYDLNNSNSGIRLIFDVNINNSMIMFCVDESYSLPKEADNFTLNDYFHSYVDECSIYDLYSPNRKYSILTFSYDNATPGGFLDPVGNPYLIKFWIYNNNSYPIDFYLNVTYSELITTTHEYSSTSDLDLRFWVVGSSIIVVGILYFRRKQLR